MKSEFFLDLSEESSSVSYTPSLTGKRLPFYLESAGHFYSCSKYFTEREELDTYLIIFTLSGQGVLRYRGREYILNKDSIVMLYCNEYHFYKTISKEPWEFKFLHINGSACMEYFNLINHRDLNIIELEDRIGINALIDNLLHNKNGKDLAAEITNCTSLNSLLSNLLLSKLQPTNDIKYIGYREEINKVISYIEENYYKKINIDDFIRIVHMSKYHFLRIFKKYTGSSPYEFLTNYRMKVAKNILKSSELPITEVSLKCGYINTNNFIRDFKKYAGLTPYKYRIIDVK